MYSKSPLEHCKEVVATATDRALLKNGCIGPSMNFYRHTKVISTITVAFTEVLSTLRWEIFILNLVTVELNVCIAYLPASRGNPEPYVKLMRQLKLGSSA